MDSAVRGLWLAGVQGDKAGPALRLSPRSSSLAVGANKQIMFGGCLALSRSFCASWRLCSSLVVSSSLCWNCRASVDRDAHRGSQQLPEISILETLKVVQMRCKGVLPPDSSSPSCRPAARLSRLSLVRLRASGSATYEGREEKRRVQSGQ